MTQASNYFREQIRQNNGIVERYTQMLSKLKQKIQIFCYPSIKNNLDSLIFEFKVFEGQLHDVIDQIIVTRMQWQLFEHFNQDQTEEEVHG